MEEPEEEQRINLKEFVVGSLPSLFYIPNFISDSEQAELLHHVSILSFLFSFFLKEKNKEVWV